MLWRTTTVHISTTIPVSGSQCMISPVESGFIFGSSYRAYLDLSSLGSEAKAISMSFDDSETTGIREVNTADSSDTPIYDLTGRRINKPQRGQIYIQNGKKRVANF